MYKKSSQLTIAIAAALFAAGAFAQDTKAPAKPAAPAAAAPSAPKQVVVNGTLVPQARVTAMMDEAKAAGQPVNDPNFVNAVQEELANRELLSQAAAKKGLDKRADVAAQMDMARQAVLIRALFDDHVKANPVSDADLKKQYEEFKAQMGDNEYKARHILVEKEDEAKAIIADLGKGGDFAKIAKDKSKDTGSKENGGDLDWGPAGRYVKPFGDAMKALKKGETTKEPVKTNFGFHVIRLDDVRAMKHPSFDEMKANFAQRAQQEQIQKLIVDLRSKAKVEYR